MKTSDGKEGEREKKKKEEGNTTQFNLNLMWTQTHQRWRERE